ncbi:transketolase family protein [Rhodospirillum sp. A1_3_36]|uniref:transketolase family protein n=1 Tax=Rhodospirillum sp. A1_3_36 TaxID=3391666 RepID=UPI0039A40220
MDFRDSVFEAIRDLMRVDPAVMVVTNDMGAMVLDQIREEWPGRVVNVGIAEQNMMSLCGGLALAGRKVFAFGIAAHVATRCWEQIKLDICAPNLPVVIVGVGPGLAYGNDGPTHHATEDLALMATLPNMAIYNPCDPINTIQCVRLAYAQGGPGYLRLDKERIEPVYELDEDVSQGFKVLREGADVTILSTGVLTIQVLKAAALLEEEGIMARVVDVFRLKPLDDAAIEAFIGTPKRVVTVEEHNISNAFGARIALHLARRANAPPLTTLGLPDAFLFGSASRAWVHQASGLTPDGLAATIISVS